MKDNKTSKLFILTCLNFKLPIKMQDIDKKASTVNSNLQDIQFRDPIDDTETPVDEPLEENELAIDIQLEENEAVDIQLEENELAIASSPKET